MSNKTSFSSFDERKWEEKKNYQVILDFFNNSNFEVIDVSENSKYFNADIDLFVIKDNDKIAIEVKIDTWIWITNNFFLEIISNEEKTTKWCFLKSKADIRIYFDAKNNIMYMFPLNNTRKWFFNLRENFINKKDIDKYFRLQSTHTMSSSWNYQHTTIWRVVNKNIFLSWLKKYNIGFLKKDISEKINIEELKNIF